MISRCVREGKHKSLRIRRSISDWWAELRFCTPNFRPSHEKKASFLDETKFLPKIFKKSKASLLNGLNYDSERIAFRVHVFVCSKEFRSLQKQKKLQCMILMIKV